MNDALRLGADEARRLSVAAAAPADVPVFLLIGGDEPVAFQEQSDLLARRWSAAGGMVGLSCVPGRDHFDILDDLAERLAAWFATLTETAG